MKTKLSDLIIRSADSGRNMQDEQGYLPGGHNGPWDVINTNVRTTAHWALIFFESYKITNDEQYLKAAIRACDYLLSNEARPYGRSFFCINREDGKSLNNGLIGQAWAIEPLIIIGNGIGDDRYIDTARYIISIHPYSFTNHAWSAVDIDGRIIGEHRTLNQQIWMTAMCIMLGKDMNDKRLLEVGFDFYKHAEEKFVILKKGLIGQKCRTKQDPAKTKKPLARILQGRNLIKRSEAYLTFLLYGIALAYELIPEEDFWNGLNLKKHIHEAISYIEKGYPYGFLENINSFRWSYNPTGIEMAYIMQTFYSYLGKAKDTTFYDRLAKWLCLQFEGYFDVSTNLLIRNTGDPNILAARLYEATRINDLEIDFLAK